LPDPNTPTEPSLERISKGTCVLLPVHREVARRPISEWKDISRSSELTKQLELVNRLKTEYGLGHGHANALVAYACRRTASAERLRAVQVSRDDTVTVGFAVRGRVPTGQLYLTEPANDERTRLLGFERVQLRHGGSAVTLSAD
jgi:hypothetical protein